MLVVIWTASMIAFVLAMWWISTPTVVTLPTPVLTHGFMRGSDGEELFWSTWAYERYVWDNPSRPAIVAPVMSGNAYIVSGEWTDLELATIGARGSGDVFQTI